MVKVAHDPLLAPGRHELTMDELETLAVQGRHACRAGLFAELRRLRDQLANDGFVCELWVDGSFLSEKVQPNDIDVLFWAYAADLMAMDPAVVAPVLSILDGGKQYSPLLDTYINIKFPHGDPRAGADQTNYWAELWGKGWDDFLTAYVVVKVG